KGTVRSRKEPLTSVASSARGTFTSTTCPCRPLYCPSLPLGGGGAFGNNSTGKTLVRSTTSMISVRSKLPTRRPACFNAGMRAYDIKPSNLQTDQNVRCFHPPTPKRRDASFRKRPQRERSLERGVSWHARAGG